MNPVQAVETARKMSDNEIWVRDDAIISLAGPAAGRRALRGSEPGWRRCISWESMAAHHEAGHLVAAWAAKHPRHTYGAAIIPDVCVQVGNTRIRGGYAWFGSHPKPASSAPPSSTSRHVENDIAQACRHARVLAWGGGWQQMLSVMRCLRLEAEALIELHWTRVVGLSDYLYRAGTLGQAEIERILPPGGPKCR